MGDVVRLRLTGNKESANLIHVPHGLRERLDALVAHIAARLQVSRAEAARIVGTAIITRGLVAIERQHGGQP